MLSSSSNHQLAEQDTYAGETCCLAAPSIHLRKKNTYAGETCYLAAPFISIQIIRKVPASK